MKSVSMGWAGKYSSLLGMGWEQRLERVGLNLYQMGLPVVAGKKSTDQVVNLLGHGGSQKY